MTQDQTLAGERVIAGRYAMIREIGRGGMGVVWLAEDRTIGRRVAIKELRLADGADLRERQVLEERVLREARTAGRLNDPAVVTVYDVLREASTTFIVMELIQAPTLADVVARDGPLPPGLVVRIAGQLLSALGVAHAAGVVHRDVKPSNIMVLPNGRVKLTDFGIAQSTDDPRITTSGILVGSPVYMAPERLRGEDADAGSDLWALGAVLFFAVEGYAPFERDNTAASIQAILNEMPYVTRCPGPLAAVITGLLNAHPEARPSGTEVRRLLARAAAAPPTRSPTAPVPAILATATQRTPPPVPRRRRSALMSAAVVAVTMLVGGYLLRVVTEPSGTGESPPAMEPTLSYGTGGDLQDFTWDSDGRDGVCLNGDLNSSTRITESDQVECTEPHLLEVYDWMVFWEKPDDCECPDIGHPGLAELSSYTEELCGIMFESELVTDTSGLRYRALVPTEQTWDTSRTVACVLYDSAGDKMDRSFVARPA